jgi:hypothetical protein
MTSSAPQGLAAFHNAFWSDAAASGADPQLNARVGVATYQTLDIDSDKADATYLKDPYPEDCFCLTRP